MAVAELEIVTRVKERAGLRGAREATRALTATLGALRCALADDDAHALAAALPAKLARPLERPANAAVSDARELYAEVDRRTHLGAGFAVEHAQAAMQVLAETLEGELVTRLRKHLPDSVAALLERRPAPPPPPPHEHLHPAHRAEPIQTLSRSRPGTAEPIADVHHEVAHAASVARSRTPHTDRAVGTARSTRPSREDDTLATTRGRSDRR
jgi:uncharacterized protein (DUF2267 family)